MSTSWLQVYWLILYFKRIYYSMIRSVDQFACPQPVSRRRSVSYLPVGVSVCLSAYLSVDAWFYLCIYVSVSMCLCVYMCGLSIGLSVGGLSGGRSVHTGYTYTGIKKGRKWGTKVYLTTTVYSTTQPGPRHRLLYRKSGFRTKMGELIIRNWMVMESKIRRMNDSG